MTGIFNLLFSFFSDLFDLLGSYYFIIFGYSVSLLQILVTLIIVSMVCSVVWFGARG